MVAGRGVMGASAPGDTVQGVAFGGAKIWNSEIWPFLANWRLHCRMDSAYSVIYITLFQHRHVPEVRAAIFFLAFATDQPKFHCIT